jgi:hypothetical protein
MKFENERQANHRVLHLPYGGEHIGASSTEAVSHADNQTATIVSVITFMVLHGAFY